MNASAIPENVITGIIAGVSAGVILAILVESKRYVDFKMKRRRQIRYIRQIVEKCQELILSAADFSLDMVRGAHFGDTYREIVETLEGRADTLTFDEKRELRGAFGSYNLVLPGRDLLYPPSGPNGAGYHKMFDAFDAGQVAQSKEHRPHLSQAKTARRRNLNVTKLGAPRRRRTLTIA